MKKRFWLVVTVGISFSPVVLATIEPVPSFNRAIKEVSRAPASESGEIKGNDYGSKTVACSAYNSKERVTFDSNGQIKSDRKSGASEIK